MRRRIALVVALVATTLALPACTSSDGPHLTVMPVARASGSFVSHALPSGYAITLSWGTIPFAGVTGYNVSLNGIQVGTSTSSPYTFTGLACGTTYTLGVQAHNGSGGTGQTYTTSYATPTCPGGGGGVQVGAPTPTGVACTGSPLNAGANVASALSAASPGSTICLNSGSWSAISLNGVAPTSNVTLAATPGQTVVVPGIEIDGAQNLTVEGFSITQPGNGDNNGFQLEGTISGGVTLEYNTIEDQPTGAGVYASPDAGGGSNTISGVTVKYNQIDHVGGGFQIDGGSTEESNWTISHNVIGPDIAYQDTNQAVDLEHYIEFGGVAGATIDHNAFEGPMDPNYITVGVHNNALHVDGTASNVTFDNNIIWEGQSRGQTILVQQGQFDNITVDNNLDVEDPSCLTNVQCYTNPVDIEVPHGLTFNHNTIVDGYYGLQFGPYESGDYTSGSGENMTAEDNIDGPSSTQGNYAIWDCASSCTTAANASGDTTANSVLGGSGNVVSWTPTWTTTTWTPNDGQPWSPPPSGYYQPTGLGISGAGYQGAIGP